MSGCGAVGPDDDLGDSTGGTTGGDVSTSNDDLTATQGQSSTTVNATGVSASTTGPGDTGTSTTTGADPSATATATSATTGADPSATTTSAGETGGPILECGIEIDPAGGNFEAVCGCDTCDLYYTDLDYDAFEEIADRCDCLCEAAGCGTNSNEAVAAAEDGSEGRGEASSG